MIAKKYKFIHNDENILYLSRPLVFDDEILNSDFKHYINCHTR